MLYKLKQFLFFSIYWQYKSKMMFELSNDYLSNFGFNGQQLSPKTYNPKKNIKTWWFTDYLLSVGKNQNLVKGKSYAHAIGVKYLSLFPQQSFPSIALCTQESSFSTNYQFHKDYWKKPLAN